MQKRNSVPEQIQLEQRKKLEEERQKLVVQSVKLPNGVRFTLLKPVGA
jgi:hypothetical protein